MAVAMKIAEGLWQLDVPLEGNPLKNLNSYLFLGERNLLVDTGFRSESCRTALESQLRELHVDMDRTDIFLTHQHSDHAGLAVDLHRPGCRILVSEIDGKALEQNGTPEAWRLQYDSYIRNGFTMEEMRTLWETNPAKALAAPPYNGYEFVADGQCLHYGGRTLRAILTPGHTPGHMCLYDADNRVLLSGDHVLFHITPNITRWRGMEGDALGVYLESLEKVKNLPVDTLLPSHRQILGDLHSRVEELERHHRQRLENTYRAVEENPGSNAYEIAGKMSWSIRCRDWEDFPLNQKYFAVGEAMSHLDYLSRRGYVTVTEERGKEVYYTAKPFCTAEEGE
jgi:glyoxylase-like metal-dependent hydrolase (beta-lactamase superfamily II)